jgi:hypothetical protein
MVSFPSLGTTTQGTEQEAAEPFRQREAKGGGSVDKTTTNDHGIQPISTKQP